MVDRVRVRVRLSQGRAKGGTPLRDLAFETRDLTDILTDDDIRGLANAADVVMSANRSHDDRWREVLEELAGLGATTPNEVDVTIAVQLLNANDRTIEFVADLTAAVVAESAERRSWLGP